MTELRSHRRRKDAHMTLREVRAAWKLHYEGGMPLIELGRKLYRRYGYAEPRVAANALGVAFRREGLPTHGRKIAWSARRRCQGVRFWPSVPNAPLTGDRCTHVAVDGSAFCFWHQDQREETA